MYRNGAAIALPLELELEVSLELGAKIQILRDLTT